MEMYPVFTLTKKMYAFGWVHLSALGKERLPPLHCNAP